ncbi:MAG TPA: histidine kinase dimerization/phospho-acceptor domain-containing protein, partial [Nitrososphaera sp.]|nr:histidine kinase dimerization/phospho-acceptor domain-containing protein [Nitrososphaera sp.]
MRSQIAILVAIIAASLSTAFILYTSSVSAAETVNELALQNIRSNAEIQASDLSHILASKIQGVASNLQVISITDGVQNQEPDKARIVLDEGQNSTSDLTSFYMLLDKDGKMLLISNANETTMQRYGGTDLSYRDYFVKPKETLQHYYGNVIESNDNVQRVYFSYPVISREQQQLPQGGRTITTATAAGDNNSSSGGGQTGAGTFNGVVVAAVDVRQMGRFLQSQIPAKYAGSVGLMDSHGAILYSQNTTLIGKKVTGPEFQSLLLSAGREFQQSFNKFLEDSLKGQTGSSHFAINGTSITIAYQPVAVQQQTFGVLYVSLAQNIGGNNDEDNGGGIASGGGNGRSIFEPASLIAQQRNMSILLIAAVGAVAVAAAYLVMSWNRKLESTVRKKTSELDTANRSLAESNAQLVEANEMLEAHDKMQTEFVNIAAHELRTPIQPIIGVIELLKSKKSKDRDNDDNRGGGSSSKPSSSSTLSAGEVEITSKQLDIMDRNAKRLQKLSSEILDATRIEAGTLRL